MRTPGWDLVTGEPASPGIEPGYPALEAIAIQVVDDIGYGRNVVLEIEDTGDDRDKAFLMGTVLIRLVEHLRMRQRAEGATRSVAAAPVGLRRSPPTAPPAPRGQAGGVAEHAVEMFAGLLAEIRAYGEGLQVRHAAGARADSEITGEVGP